MGKKRIVGYDKQALKEFAEFLKSMRRPTQNGAFLELQINLEKLEEAIKKLPKKEREVIEKFHGLIPGTPIRAKMTLAQLCKDASMKNMRDAAFLARHKLFEIEYLRMYERNTERMVQNLLKKINKKGVEYLSEEDILKYFLIFLIFIVGGHKMIFEEEGANMDLKREAEAKHDVFTLLSGTWNGSGHILDDESINMKLLLTVIDMFDLKDVIAMKRYVGLPIDAEFCSIETEPLNNFKDVRLFKEKLFSYGAWDVTTVLIYSQSIEELDLSEFRKNLPVLRADWNKIGKFKTGEAYIATSEGNKKVDIYKMGDLRFTDIYEVMVLYVGRNLLLD